MMTIQKSRPWRVAPVSMAARLMLANALGVRPVVAQILLNRGFAEPEAARSFLSSDLSLIRSPYALPDMDRAVVAIERAVAEQQRIVVYGDYDADGQAATALLVRLLRAVGAHVRYYIPNRVTEGYGLNQSALERVLADGADLLVTVDCGTTAVAEIAWAKKAGLPVVVTDHHEPSDTLPDAVAVVNPKRPDSDYPFLDLCGCALAYKLGVALSERPRFRQALKGVCEAHLDLVAVATICDVVSLIDENRALVRAGLERLGARRANPGLIALSELTGLQGRDPTTTDVGFRLGPRLNAAGRIGDARLSVELLLADEMAQAQLLARRLEETNRERQAVEARVVAQAVEWVERHLDLDKQHALVVAGEGWHPGVIGIVASRLVDRYQRPALVFSVADGYATGSGRSVPGVDLFEAISSCSDLFERFGGHAGAAGMTIRADRLETLRHRLNEAVRGDTGMVAELPVQIDALTPLADIDALLLAELSGLEPHGPGNPPPVLASLNVKVVDRNAFGKEGQHLRLTLMDERGRRVDAIAWGHGGTDWPAADFVDVAYTPELHEWNGFRQVRLQLVDLRPADQGSALEVAATAEPSGGSNGLSSNRRIAAGSQSVLMASRIHDRRGVDPVAVAVQQCQRAALHTEVLLYARGRHRAHRLARAVAAERTKPPLAVGRVTDLTSLPWRRGNEVRLILCDMPDSIDQLVDLVAHCGQFGELSLWLAFDPERELHRKRLGAGVYLGAETLRNLFRHIRERLRTGPQQLDVKALARLVPGVFPQGVRRALDIFLELGLIEQNVALVAPNPHHGIRRKAVFRLGRIPDQKLDLRLAVSYNENIARQSEIAALGRLVTSANAAAFVQAVAVASAHRSSFDTAALSISRA